MATQGVEMPDRNVPMAVAKPLAAASRRASGACCSGVPAPAHPAGRLAVRTRVHDRHTKARTELGYEPVSVEEGMAELRAA